MNTCCDNCGDEYINEGDLCTLCNDFIASLDKNTDKAVEAFAEEMKCKLRQQNRLGYQGWDDNSFSFEQCVNAAFSHLRRLDKGDRAQAVDIANFMMFIGYKNNG